jgi:hypothetical protein
MDSANAGGRLSDLGVEKDVCLVEARSSAGPEVIEQEDDA